MNNLDKLKQRKNALKKEVDELEDLLTFKNTKNSLSTMTHGLSDLYLKEKKTEEGEVKTVLKKDYISKEIVSFLSNLIFKKKNPLGSSGLSLNDDFIDNALKFGTTALVTNFTSKKLNSNRWQTKALGFAIVYIAPIVLKKLRENLEEYQQKESIKSIEKLI